MFWRRVCGGLLVLTLVTVLPGCLFMGAIAHYFKPRQIQKPEYVFPPGSRVAMVVDAARSEYENPVFAHALHARLIQMLRQGESEAQMLPLQEVEELRRSTPDFKSWSLQRIGRELGADHVLYIRITQLQIRQTPDYPILEPEVELRMKLIGVQQPSPHARLWPEDEQGHEVSCKRHTPDRAATHPEAVDAETMKLGYETAYWVSMPFIEVDLEEKPPVED